MNDTNPNFDPAFLNLVMLLGSSAMQQLGQPLGSRQETSPIDLRSASMTIDMLAAMEAKCKNTLTPDETRLMKDTLYSLRTRYVSVSESQKKTGSKPAAAAPGK